MPTINATPGTPLAQFSDMFIKSDAICAALGMSKPTWNIGVKEGRFPAPVRLTPRRPVWRKADIESLIATL